MAKDVDNLLLVEHLSLVTKVLDAVLELWERGFVIGVVKGFESDEVNCVFGHVEFWGVGCEVMEAGLNGQVFGFLEEEVFHFDFVRGVLIQEHMEFEEAGGLEMRRQIGHVIGDLLGFCFFVGLEEAVCREKFDG